MLNKYVSLVALVVVNKWSVWLVDGNPSPLAKREDAQKIVRDKWLNILINNIPKCLFYPARFNHVASDLCEFIVLLANVYLHFGHLFLQTCDIVSCPKTCSLVASNHTLFHESTYKAKLLATLQSAVSASNEDDRLSRLEPIDELITFSQFACDEGDFGQAIELGLSLLAFHPKSQFAITNQYNCCPICVLYSCADYSYEKFHTLYETEVMSTEREMW